MQNKRLPFIDGYKGILCFMIMLGHFWNIYRGTSGASPLDHRILDAITNASFSSWVLVATFWLYAFLVISGYLLSFSSVKSVPDLLTKVVSRFLRLFIPIFGACFIIFILYKTIGFYADDTAIYFTSSWFQKYYQESFVFKDIFTESYHAMFTSSCAFNAPFWVIGGMMLASVLMYICKLVDHIFKKKTHVLPLLFTLCSLFVDNQVVTACFVGFLIGYYQDGLNLLTTRFSNFIIVSAAVYGIFLWLKAENIFPSVFDKITNYTLIHSFLLIVLNQFSVPQRIFSIKPFLLAGKINFGVYAFHWPVICSVGSLILLAGIQQNWHPIVIYFSSLFLSVVATIVLSIFYHFTVEKFCEFVIRFVKKIGIKLV